MRAVFELRESASTRSPLAMLTARPQCCRTTAIERGTAGLRGRLRLMAGDHGADAPPDWSTPAVAGLTTDARGDTWFEYLATVASGSRADGWKRGGASQE